jgi:hypothetical protein
MTEPLQRQECNSIKLFKDGIRHSRHGEVQRFLCRSCGNRFSKRNGNNYKTYQTNSTAIQICTTRPEVKNLDTLVSKELAGESPKNEDIKGPLFQFASWMKKVGYAEDMITTRVKILKILSKRGAVLNCPESIKGAIAKQSWSNKRKINAYKGFG